MAEVDATVDVVPTEQVPEAETTETPPEPAEQQPGQQPDDPYADAPPYVKREITIARNRQREAEQRAEQAERERAQLAEAFQRMTAKPPEPEEQEPQQADFETDGEYYRALGKWEAKKEVRAELAAREKREADAKAEQERAEVRTRYMESVTAARDKYDDYDDVLGSSRVGVSDAVRDALLTSKYGGEVAYHLAKHPDDAIRISALPPLAAAREIGRIEAAIVAAPVTKPAVSKAPPPVQPVGASGKVDKNPYEMSADEFYDQLQREAAQKRRR